MPSSRQSIDALIDSFAAAIAEDDHDGDDTSNVQNANPLHKASATAKAALLTLHVLFPAHLLSALDLLDRGLVSQMILDATDDDGHDDFGGGENTNANTNANTTDPGQNSTTPGTRTISVYHVRSAAQHRHRGDVACYEVRLRAWSCTCPAFCFAAFPPERQGHRPPTVDDGDDGRERGHDGDGDGSDDDTNTAPTAVHSATSRPHAARNVQFAGGLTRHTTDNPLPVCKHLLACLLADRCAALGPCLDRRTVGRCEFAAWAAGWAD